jgi:hypothetical protein
MRVRFIEKFTLQHVSCASGIINPIARTEPLRGIIL